MCSDMVGKGKLPFCMQQEYTPVSERRHKWEYCGKGVWLLEIKQTQIKLMFILENHKSANFVTHNLLVSEPKLQMKEVKWV